MPVYLRNYGLRTQFHLARGFRILEDRSACMSQCCRYTNNLSKSLKASDWKRLIFFKGVGLTCLCFGVWWKNVTKKWDGSRTIFCFTSSVRIVTRRSHVIVPSQLYLLLTFEPNLILDLPCSTFTPEHSSKVVAGHQRIFMCLCLYCGSQPASCLTTSQRAVHCLPSSETQLPEHHICSLE